MTELLPATVVSQQAITSEISKLVNTIPNSNNQTPSSGTRTATDLVPVNFIINYG